MQLTIGGRQQITQCTVLVPDGEDAWIEFSAGAWNVKINLIFEKSADESSQSFTLIGESDHAILKIKNWNNSLPMAIGSTYPLGTVGGRGIEMIFTGYSVGGLSKIEFIFMWEKKND